MARGRERGRAEARRSSDLLGAVPLFQGLSNRELQTIARSGKEVEHQDGREIVKEGSGEAAGFHLILDGRVKVIVGGRTRRRLGAGDYFGEMSLLDRGPRSATVVADGPVRTFSLTSWAFMPILDRHPSIAKKMLIEMSRRLRADDRSPTL